jgi:hypothetical protein
VVYGVKFRTEIPHKGQAMGLEIIIIKGHVCGCMYI